MQRLGQDLHQRLSALNDDIRSAAPEAERSRTVPQSLIDAFARAGLFRLWLPEELSGEMADFKTLLLLVEEVAQVDGSIGWTVMIGATTAAFAGRLPPEGCAEVFADAHAIGGGSVIPRGQALVTDGGYRVTGRWPFASGCMHATWLIANSRVIENGSPCMTDDGMPVTKGMFLPADACEIIDTWRSPGLCGTGSHDFEVADVFVPEQLTAPFGETKATRPEPLYRLPLRTLLGYPIGAVSLGLARASLDAFEALAGGGQTPSLGSTEVRTRASIQAEVGRAESALAASRSFYFDVADEVYEAAFSEEPLPLPLAVRSMLAASQAAETAREVTSTMFQLGGSSSIQSPNTIERCFRDAHTAAQHVAVAPANWETAGRHFLGLSPS
jgi:alkylation response protein AidB-like acyl-CoA dehydrogenase